MCSSKFIKITLANSCWFPHVSSVSNSALTHWEGDPICLYCGTGSVHDLGGRPWCGTNLSFCLQELQPRGCVQSGGKMHHLDIIVIGWNHSFKSRTSKIQEAEKSYCMSCQFCPPWWAATPARPWDIADRNDCWLLAHEAWRHQTYH